MMLLASFLLYGSQICAQDYSRAQLVSVADTYFEVSSRNSADGKDVHVTIDTLYLGNKPKMFLCQDGTNWVVFANEKSVDPIVCLGEGQISLVSLQKSPLWFLLTESMIGLDSLRISGDPIDHTRSTAMPNVSRSHPTPLLNLYGANVWDQSNNNYNYSDTNKIYNKYCPTFYNVSDGRTIVGCTAVAMGQVMWYHQWPPSANIPAVINKAGITSGGTITRYYNWNNMPRGIFSSTTQEQADSIASFLRDCGYAGHMIYGNGWSSMTLTNAKSALGNTFHYNSKMKQYSAGANAFNNIIKSEIAANRPVIIQATHATDASTHTFVIDGYDSTDEMYHINLGWGGYQNNWYSVSGANSYYNYTIARRMLYEIIPNTTAPTATEIESELAAEIKDNIIIINSVEENPIHWSIYDIYGHKLLSGSGPCANISSLSKGTYTFVAESTTSSCQTKFIK